MSERTQDVLTFGKDYFQNLDKDDWKIEVFQEKGSWVREVNCFAAMNFSFEELCRLSLSSFLSWKNEGESNSEDVWYTRMRKDAVSLYYSYFGKGKK